MTPQLDRAFLASIGSFRSLSSDEVQTLRPQKIMVVAAGSDDTAASLAARSDNGDNALDRFLMLNGLDRPNLRSGQTYKIIIAE
jgi:predicted Zn-dependent protease